MIQDDPQEPKLLVAVNMERNEFIHPHMFGESCHQHGIEEPASVFNYATRYLMVPSMGGPMSKLAGRWFNQKVVVGQDSSWCPEERDLVEYAFERNVEIDKVQLINEIALVSKPMRVRLMGRFKVMTPIVDPMFGMFTEDEIDAIRWALWIDD